MSIDKFKYWIDIANEDLAVAEDLFKAKRWLYVAFMCHQVIEKTLKAYWNAIRDDDPHTSTTTVDWLKAQGSIVKWTNSNEDFLVSSTT